jgi:hypothetical protein
MMDSLLAHQRLHSQHLAPAIFNQPGDIVRWMGAVQSQDYNAAKWAIALRSLDLSDTDIERSFNAGDFLRTHVLRPTWHFIAPEDVRWMLALTAPHVHAAISYYRRQLGLDAAILTRSQTVIANALQGGKQLTRAEMATVLEQAGIDTGGLRLNYLAMAAELDGIICSGGRRGKQFTYALLDERVPVSKNLEGGEALAELTLRYYRSHGPATEQDFAWWSGLRREQVRAGLETVKDGLEQIDRDGKTYWLAPPQLIDPASAQAAQLLPNYDEFVVGYTDRSAVFNPAHAGKLDDRQNPLYQNTLVTGGQIAGTWKRTITKGTLAVKVIPFTPLSEAAFQALARATQRYGRFLDRAVSLD